MAVPRGPRGSRVRLPARYRYGVDVHRATDGRDVVKNGPPDGWVVDEPWLWWDAGGTEINQPPEPPDGTDATSWGNPPPGAGMAPCLQVPAVTRCTSLIADTIAGLPWQTVRGRETTEAPLWLTDPQLKRMDGRVDASGLLPDWRMSSVEFWAAAVVSLLWYGEAFLYVPVRDAAGAPKAPLWLLHPSCMSISMDNWGWQANGVPLDASELIVVRGMTRPGSRRGIGVMQAHMADLMLAGAMRAFASNTLRRGVPNGYLQVTAPDVTEDAATALKAKWMEAHGGLMKSIAVLNATTNFTPLQLDPQALQLVEMRRYSLLDVALMFGVPPYMLGLPADSSTYANVESRMIEFGQFTLHPWVRRLESVLDAELPRGTSLRINLDALLRADTATRYAAHATALQAGFLTLDDVRQMEDLPPLPPAGPNPPFGNLPQQRSPQEG
jgi:phage portal protein, HK97 family